MRTSLLLCILFFSTNSVAYASGDVLQESLTVVRADGSRLRIDVTRAATDAPVPLLLVIDGSLCIPSRTGRWVTDLLAHSDRALALVTVEKPGPTSVTASSDGSISVGPELTCSDEFRRYYSIDQRVLDHLRGIQYLRHHVDWWDGRLYVWGFSDGGRIGARVAAFSTETAGAVLGGFGGGMPMAVELEDFHICADDRTDDRAACLHTLRAKFEEMRRSPTSEQTWLGESNTWRAWSSRIDGIEANILSDTTFRLAIFHGERDNAVPVESARMLAERLRYARDTGFKYFEITGMGHGLGSGLPDSDRERLYRDLFDWVFGVD